MELSDVAMNDSFRSVLEHASLIIAKWMKFGLSKLSAVIELSESLRELKKEC